MISRKHILLAVVCAAAPVWAADTAALDKQYQAVAASFVALSRQVQQQSPFSEPVILLGYEPESEFVLESVEMTLDGAKVLSHQYQLIEQSSLAEGGLHTLHQGQLAAGSHKLVLTLKGKTAAGEPFSESSQIGFTVSSGLKGIELSLKDRGKRAPKVVRKEL